MKAQTIVVAGLLAAATVPPAHADDLLPTRQGVTFLGSTAAGVALAGPVGLLAGALVGAWFSDKLETAADAEAGREALAVARTGLEQAEGRMLQTSREIAALQVQLREAQEASNQYAQLMLEQLELEMLFRTNQPELTEAGQRRLQTLATFLGNNPHINVRLDGYADPRGESSYNMQLSLARASHIARALQELGVDPARIQTFGHGDSQSSAGEGDYDAYALERVVKIKLSPGAATGLAHMD
jgi:outer membrane protein OmpA-like peptidoglycan-associated protein